MSKQRSLLFIPLFIAAFITASLGNTSQTSPLEESFKKAENGDPDAQYLVGSFYAEGNGVEKDLADAFKWFLEAAKNNHPSAQYNAGILLIKGLGVEKNADLGERLIRQAAENGHNQAQYIIGYNLRLSNPAKARFWFKKSAEGGNPAAEFELAEIIKRSGINDGKEFTEQVHHYMSAALWGYKPAKKALGQMFVEKDLPLEISVTDEGRVSIRSAYEARYGIRGFAQDKELECILTIARNGNPYAEYLAGAFYCSKSSKTLKNLEIAKTWLNKSATNNSVEARKILENFRVITEYYERNASKSIDIIDPLASARRVRNDFQTRAPARKTYAPNIPRDEYLKALSPTAHKEAERDFLNLISYISQQPEHYQGRAEQEIHWTLYCYRYLSEWARSMNLYNMAQLSNREIGKGTLVLFIRELKGYGPLHPDSIFKLAQHKRERYPQIYAEYLESSE